MGDPNGNWNDLKWTAEKMYEHGMSLIPLDGNKKPLVDWKKSMESDVSKIPLETILDWIDDEAEGLAISFCSSFNGELWCRTFDKHSDYMETVTLMGQNAVPLAACLKEDGKYHVLFMMEEFENSQDFEEIRSGMFQITNPSGTIRSRYTMLRIPPTEGCKWIQEPVVNFERPNVCNLYYYDPISVGLLPPF